MKDIETVVSDNIKKLLKEYKINQTELSKITGVSESTVGKWVLKKATPRMGAVQKISDHFGLPKSYILEEEERELPAMIQEYNLVPAEISAGLPIEVDGISQVDKISLPDSVMGKWAGDKDIKIMRINGDSMNKTMPHNSLIAVKPVELANLKNDDIVVFSDEHEYSVKRYYDDKENERIVFRPHSTDRTFIDNIFPYDNLDGLQIHGKVVMYIVELD